MHQHFKIATLFAAMLFSMACGQHQPATNAATAQGHYTCTMHPKVHSNKPGICPKCGMQLVNDDDDQ